MASLPAWGQPLVAAAESVEASAVVQASVALAAAPVVPVGAAVAAAVEGAAAERPAPVSALVLEWTLFLKTRKALRSPRIYQKSSPRSILIVRFFIAWATFGLASCAASCVGAGVDFSGTMIGAPHPGQRSFSPIKSRVASTS